MKNYNIINISILFFSIFLICLQIWLERFFGQVDFEQLLVFIAFGFYGLLDADDYIISKFIEICLYLPIALTTLYVLFITLISKSKNFFKINFNTKLINYQFSLILLVFFYSIYNLSNYVSFKDFLIRDKNYDFIKDNYSAPNIEKIKNIDSKKDLVLIYIEGLEEAFINKNFISENTIKDLSLNDYNSRELSNFYQTKYNNWTVGAIVSTQCGIPQKPLGILDTRKKGFVGNRNVFGLKSFLPNAICLGDILKAKNYHNIFINSVDLEFQAMKTFLVNHGYDELIGKKFFTERKETKDYNSWAGGVHDKDLFDLAKKKIIQNKEEKKRFNLTVLTTDTHNPGYVDKNCKFKFKPDTKKMFKALTCTAHELEKFVDFIYRNYSNDTAIIIVGDHLNRHIEDYVAPHNLKNLKRSVYNKFIDKDFDLYREQINHFDLYPTILDILDFNINDKLGLGYSALKPTNIDYDLYKKDLIKNIGNKSKFYDAFWK
jgi:phosphoglycerol transferase